MKEQENLEQEYFDENQYEIENRIRNLYWTVSGNYGENIKLDTVSFSRSPWVSLYDAVKQGAFSRYFDRNAFGFQDGVDAGADIGGNHQTLHAALLEYQIDLISHWFSSFDTVPAWSGAGYFQALQPFRRH